MGFKGMSRAVHRAIDVGQGYSGKYEVTYGVKPWTAELWHENRLLASATGLGDSDAHLSVETSNFNDREKSAITDFFRACGQPEGHIEVTFQRGFWSKYDEKPKVLKLGKKMREIPLKPEDRPSPEGYPDEATFLGDTYMGQWAGTKETRAEGLKREREERR
jgi:hypothetical protein